MHRASRLATKFLKATMTNGDAIRGFFGYIIIETRDEQTAPWSLSKKIFFRKFCRSIFLKYIIHMPFY